jgi:hypothetical protein
MLIDGYIDYRILADGRLIGVIPLTFGRARIVITEDRTGYSYSDGW